MQNQSAGSITLAVLGAGKMGGALVRGWVAAGVVAPERIRLYNAHPETAQALADDVDRAIMVAASPQEAVRGADVVMVSVKPHIVAQSLSVIKDALEPDTLLVSVAAGVTLETLENGLLPGTPVIRVMPNTPALIRAGASAFCCGSHATDAHAHTVSELFGAVGRCVEVTEAQINAVIGVSGSAPAYFYLIIEALTDGGVRAGLPRDVARTLAAQTALGAARMVLETGEHPMVLKDAVTTPGGTTIAALGVLESSGIRGALMDAVRAAVDRAKEMG